MTVAILAVVYPSIILAMAFAVSLSHRQFRRAIAQRDQAFALLREAHSIIDFMGSAHAYIVASQIQRDVVEQRQALVKVRSN